MRLGQPFYKLNQSYNLSTFEEHKFNVLFILGVDAANDRSTILECSIGKFTLTEANNTDRYENETVLSINYNVDDFTKLTDAEQNNLLFELQGYTSNPEELRSDHKTMVQDKINAERIIIQQKIDKLNQIENAINNDTINFVSVLTSGEKVKDRFIFEATLNGANITSSTLFFVENVQIDSNIYTPSIEGIYTLKAVYNDFEYSFEFEVLPQ